MNKKFEKLRIICNSIYIDDVLIGTLKTDSIQALNFRDFLESDELEDFIFNQNFGEEQ